MYYEHFGLTQAPFKITPNTDFFFGGGNRGPILEALIYAITQGEGIVKVSGEVGSGKTMLCSMLQSRLPEHVETIYLANPSVSPEEILHAIAFELQLDLPRDASRLVVMHAVQDHLLKRHAEGRRVVLFVEESQGMPLPTLEEIRLLSNLETKSDKLLQIVLFGQPELDENLQQNQIRQLKERITHSFRLEPLTVQETREYLMFRLRAAGYRGPELFPEAIVREIARISAGLTRRINLIADKTLLAAFSENTHSIRQKHVDAAVRDSEFAKQNSPAPDRSRWALGLTLVLLGMVAGAGGLYVWLGGFTQPGGQAETAPAAALDANPPAAAAAPTENENKLLNSMTSTPSAIDAPALEPTPAPPAAVVSAAATPAAATTAPAAEAAAKSDDAPKGTLLEQRLAATAAWLATAAPQTYTVQLFGATNEVQLNQHLKSLANLIEINSVFVYRTTAKGAPALTVTLGSFDSQRAARDAMAKLPSKIRAYRPLLRTAQGIRTELGDPKS